MKRPWMPSGLILIALFGLLQGIDAAPHQGDTFELRQPDGTQVPVRVFGDEFHQDVESLEGHTLVRDPKTGWIHFAELDPQSGDLVPSKTRYGIGKRSLQSRKGLRANQSLVQQHRRANQQALGYDQLVEEGPWSAPSSSLSMEEGSPSPAPAEPRRVMGLTILVNFPDQKSTFTQQNVDDFCNLVGYNANNNRGSIFEYYRDVSNGWLLYNNIVTAWVTVDKNKSYYDQGPGYGPIQEFITNILTKLQQQSGLDLSQLTIENNRAVALNILYAGSATAGWAEGLWPHQGTYTGTTAVQGVRFSRYQMAGLGTGMSIGTFIHENGHMVMRWPDLYSYESPIHSNGVGRYCIMSAINQTNPQQPNAYFRQLAGWINVEDITGRAIGTQYSHVANSHSAFNYVRNTKEFYVIEARRREGRSAGLPSEGLAIWHVHKDGDNTRSTKGFPLVALIQADGLRHLENKVNTGDANDLFKSTGNARFNATTNPKATWHDGTNATIDIAEISAAASTMTFKIGPNAAVTTYGLTVVGGQGSGSYSPGQLIQISAPDSGANGLFLRWTSANLSIVDPYQQATSVIMANVSSTVTAKFQVPKVLPGTLTAIGAGHTESVLWNTEVATLADSSELEWIVRISDPGYYRLNWTTETGSTGSAILQNLSMVTPLDTIQSLGSGNKVVLLDSGTFIWRLAGNSGTVRIRNIHIERVWTVAVEGGFGSGYYAQTESVRVEVEDPLNFFRWHSQGIELQNPYADSLQFLMVNANVILNAVTPTPYPVPGRIQAETYHYHTSLGIQTLFVGQDGQGIHLSVDQGIVAYKLQVEPHTADIQVRAKSIAGAVLVLRDNMGWSDTLRISPSSSWVIQSGRSKMMNANASVLEALVIQGELDLDWINFEVHVVNVSRARGVDNLSIQQVHGGIHYTLSQESNVQIRILDLNGKLIREWDLGRQLAGAHTLSFDEYPSLGVYWVQLRAGREVQTIRLVGGNY